MSEIESGCHFQSADGRKATDSDAIFPILRAKDGRLDIVGTGFYIAREGIFVTARHCFEHEGDIASDHSFVILQMGEGNIYYRRPILRAWHSSQADVSVGIAAQMNHKLTNQPLLNQVMVLTAERPPVGTQVVTYAFGNSQQEVAGSKTKLLFEPRFQEGILIDYFPNGRDRVMINWPVYETSLVIHGGASGGPVVGTNGTVFAINTSSMDGQPDVSYVTPIDFILDAELDGIVLPPDMAPRKYKIRDLARKGWFAFRPEFPTRS